MNKIIITDAQYNLHTVADNNKHTEANNTIKCMIDGIKMQVPTDPANRHYVEILAQVKAGTLTIKDAD